MYNNSLKLDKFANIYQYSCSIVVAIILQLAIHFAVNDQIAVSKSLNIFGGVIIVYCNGCSQKCLKCYRIYKSCPSCSDSFIS